MYNDIINNVSFNVKTAHLLGLNTAVYWAVLCDISLQVVKKQTYDDEGYFHLDRDYVERQTALSHTEQMNCDTQLSKVGLLQVHRDDPDKIGLYVKNWVALITEDDPATLQAVLTQSKKTGRTTKEGKMAGYKRNIKRAIITEYPEELTALETFTDVIVDAEKGFCSPKQMEAFQKTLYTAFPADLEARLKCIEIATARVYKDASWAVNAFRKEFPMGVASVARQRKVSTVGTETF